MSADIHGCCYGSLNIAKVRLWIDIPPEKELKVLIPPEKELKNGTAFSTPLVLSFATGDPRRTKSPRIVVGALPCK